MICGFEIAVINMRPVYRALQIEVDLPDFAGRLYYETLYVLLRMQKNAKSTVRNKKRRLIYAVR